MGRTVTATVDTEPQDKTYLMRGIDPKLWHRFNVAAVTAQTDMKTILLTLVRGYVDGVITIDDDGAVKCRRKGGAQ